MYYLAVKYARLNRLIIVAMPPPAAIVFTTLTDSLAPKNIAASDKMLMKVRIYVFMTVSPYRKIHFSDSQQTEKKEKISSINLYLT